MITLLMLLTVTIGRAQTKTEVLKELHRQGIPHANIVLAQARLETGNFKSRRCTVDHNLFGIKHGRRYARYSHWRESVADYKKRISSRYEGGDYYSFLKRIHYAESKDYIQRVKKIADGMARY